jgi:ribosomal protein S8E
VVKLYEGASVTKHIAEYTDANIVNAETGSYKDIEVASVTKHSAEHTNASILDT